MQTFPFWHGARSLVRLVLTLLVPLLLSRCSPSGDSLGRTEPPERPSTRAARQAIETLLQGYGQAVRAEDIDRLQALLQSASTLVQSNGHTQNRLLRQDADGTFPTLTVGDEVLAPLFCTEADDPPRTGYRRLLFDLTPYAGQRVGLRFASNQTGLGLVVGIDNVRVLATGVAP